METPVHLILADRDADFLNTLEQYLGGESFYPHAIQNIRDIFELSELYPLSAALIDVNFCGTGTYALIRKLRAKSPLVIMLSAVAASLSERVLAYDTGADDFLIKPIDPAELVSRLRARLRRLDPSERCAMQSSILRYGDLTLDADSLTLRKGEAALSVTLSEYKLLVKLMRSPGRTLSKRDLYAYLSCADASAQDTLRSDDNTVMVHISKLREKIEDDPRAPKYIKTVRGEGYRFDIP